ncbi:Glycosyltransferase involved in cell wall bisynthesis [Methanobrevibacter olleyae]|uniref:Glycosyltransferase involved in cell wall bisynthesis n=1 Tax=Methanobrevibacter olleyae TaxID=294671 RepID=A0A1I4JJ78_METOL|nr:glycosyltransferase [Methanobrevibacter olleyae]SFL66609.1 Glycosyltransferase involved in cell wall bisynthesis [Methanobrevibacter olleyae]
MVKVSVIVPVYNVEKYLKECLDSIINQTLKDIEIICIDDGSTDNSLSILESYAEKDDRIKIISQENQGQGVARNTGLDNAVGNYIYFIDSDDFLELNALEELYNIAYEKSLDFVLFQLINLDDETNEYYTITDYDMPDIANLVKDNVFNYEDLDHLIFKMAVSPVNKLYNRDFINNAGARFPERLIFEDNVFFWEVLFNAKRIYFVQKHYYKRRRHSSSVTGLANIKFVDTLKIHNLIFDIFKKYNLFNKFKKKLFNKKIRLANYRFSQVNNKIKPIFFDEVKKDFEEMVEEYGYDNILTYLDRNTKSIFQNVFNSKNSEEYLLLMKKDKLEKNIKKMSFKNKKLKKEIKSIKKQNSLMLNSRSWKITKPLRIFTKFISGDNMSFKEILLNKSNSYNYLKSEYKRLSKKNKDLINKNNELSSSNKELKKQNNKLEKINDKLINQYNSLDKKIDDFYLYYKESTEKFNHNFVERDNFNKSIYKELQYAFVFEDTIKESEWLNKKDFSLINSAANYSFAYSLYRILNDVKPENILELGLGQTTKLTTQYVNHFTDSKLTVVEGDKEWIDNFSENLVINENTQILNLDLENFTYCDDETIRFKGFSELIANQKFDLIIVDGPQGFIIDSENNFVELNYSRTNIWQLIPQNLADEFIIIFDDFNRTGEKNTVKHVKELLNKNNINFYEYNSWAFKTQHAIFTENYKYIGWI